jgi:putative N-acetyltransferase (TIGR04045 family)
MRAKAPAAECRIVRDQAELAQHLRIRRRIFVEEQAIFAGTDHDEHDRDPATLHVIGYWEQQPAGTVRLYPLDQAGLWKGDRLAVLPPYRRHELGALLVRFAVASASERGGSRMIAYIQLPNVEFFARLGWRLAGEPVQYAGQPHQMMDIPLRLGAA